LFEHSTPTALYTLSLHDALPISLSALVERQSGSNEFLLPTAVLFNGGVFKSRPIRSRVLELLASWNQGQAVRELRGIELDLAVRSEEHTSELQSLAYLVCRLLLE